MRPKAAGDLGHLVAALVRLSRLDGDLRELRSADARRARRLEEVRLRREALEHVLGRERARLDEFERAGEDPGTSRALLGEIELQLETPLRQFEEAKRTEQGSVTGSQDIARLEERRQLTLAELPDALRAAYELLLRADRHPVIAPVSGGYCAGCHLRLPAQVVNRVADSRELFRCPHCQRILYDPTKAGDLDA
jgi:hypothetical protein